MANALEVGASCPATLVKITIIGNLKSMESLCSHHIRFLYIIYPTLCPLKDYSMFILLKTLKILYILVNTIITQKLKLIPINIHLSIRQRCLCKKYENNRTRNMEKVLIFTSIISHLIKTMNFMRE